VIEPSLTQHLGKLGVGYQSESITGFVRPATAAGFVPLHRLFNGASGDHFYTTSDQERNSAVANSGYQSEGEACFVSPVASAQGGFRFASIVSAHRRSFLYNIGPGTRQCRCQSGIPERGR
jgi:hypothetical protein